MLRDSNFAWSLGVIFCTVESKEEYDAELLTVVPSPGSTDMPSWDQFRTAGFANVSTHYFIFRLRASSIMWRRSKFLALSFSHTEVRTLYPAIT